MRKCMTANEIADGLAQMHIEKDVNGLFNKRIQNMLRQQQAEIEALKKFKAESDALDKKLFESIQKSNEMWDKATKLLLKKAQEK